MYQEHGPSPSEMGIDSRENEKRDLEQLVIAQEFLADRLKEAITGGGDEDARVRNLSNIEGQVKDITSRMNSLLEAVRKGSNQ